MSEPAPELQDQTQRPSDLPPARVPWSFLDAIVVYFVWLVALIFLGGLVLYGLQRAVSQEMAQALLLPVTLLMLIGTTIGYVRLRHGREAPALLFGQRRPAWGDVGFGVLAGIAALAILAFGLGTVLQLIAEALETELPNVQETFRQIAGDAAAAPLLVAGSVLVAPVAEELFFRGMVFGALRSKLDFWPAAGISGALFALSHLQTTLEGYLLVILIIAPLGVWLAWVYERRRTLVVPILVHATFNLVQVFQLISEVS